MTEIKIKTSTKEIGFKFGLGFLGKVLKEQDIDVNGLMENFHKNPFETVPLLMLESAKYYAVRHKEDFEMTIDDIIDLVDEEGGITSTIFKDFMEAFSNSISQDVPAEEIKSNTSSKKVVKKKQIGQLMSFQ